MIVSVEDLSHSYGSRSALSNVSFTVEQGEIFGLLGPNGSGKSTLFRILSTLMAPSSGRARIAGEPLVAGASSIRRRIGVVFQSNSIDKKLTVFENLTSQGHLFGLRGAWLRERCAEVLDRLGLEDRRSDLAGTLSGGLQRRVEIAKALLHRPAVMLMDEPSTGLDPAARLELWQYIAELRARQGVTVLLTTHILEEADRADRLLLLHEGKVVAAGTPAELKSRVGGDVVVIEAGDTREFSRQLSARFSVEARAVDGTVRVEVSRGHRFAAEVVEAFPGAVTSVAVHKPTLEDVFLDLTGARL